MTGRTRLSVDQKIRKIRELYAAFSRGDAAAIAGGLADNIGWHFPGSSKYSGDFKGKEVVMGRLALPLQDFEEFKLDLHDVVGSADHIVALVSSTMRRKGRTYHDREVHVLHVNDEGNLAEAWFTLNTEQFKQALED